MQIEKSAEELLVQGYNGVQAIEPEGVKPSGGFGIGGGKASISPFIHLVLVLT